MTAAEERAASEPPGAEVPAGGTRGDDPAGASQGGEVPVADHGGDLPSGSENGDAAAGTLADDTRADAHGAPDDEPPAGDEPPATASAEATSAEAAAGSRDEVLPPATELAEALAGLGALGARVDDIARAAAELSRLRSRDTDLIARLHDDVTRLRTGEIAAALNPVVTGMIKLHDQMVSLGALNDPASPVGMLHTQLLQIMELTCAVRPFTPSAGERFDASRHTGVRRIPTAQASADGTIATTIRAGFVRADGSVMRVAEVEVHRLSG